MHVSDPLEDEGWTVCTVNQSTAMKEFTFITIYQQISDQVHRVPPPRSTAMSTSTQAQIRTDLTFCAIVSGLKEVADGHKSTDTSRQAEIGQAS